MCNYVYCTPAKETGRVFLLCSYGTLARITLLKKNSVLQLRQNGAVLSRKRRGVQRGGQPLGVGFPIGARSPCWPGIPKGTAFPWPEESKETGGFVAHDLARKV